MAKVYESDIDPDEFIRSFREEPSGLSSLKKKPANENTEAAPAQAPTQAPATTDIPVNTAMPQTKSDNTDLDTEFMEKFVSDKIGRAHV